MAAHVWWLCIEAEITSGGMRQTFKMQTLPWSVTSKTSYSLSRLSSWSIAIAVKSCPQMCERGKLEYWRCEKWPRLAIHELVYSESIKLWLWNKYRSCQWILAPKLHLVRFSRFKTECVSRTPRLDRLFSMARLASTWRFFSFAPHL